MTVTGSLVAYAKLAEKMNSVQILLYIIMIYNRIRTQLIVYMYIYALFIGICIYVYIVILYNNFTW